MKKYELIEKILLGGKGSGHHGHQGGSGGPGNPGGSTASGAGGSIIAGTIGLRGKSKGKSAPYYRISGKAPKEILDAKDSLLMVPPGKGDSYGMVASGSEMAHALYASKLGITGDVFDSYVRPSVINGVVLFSSSMSGGRDPSDKAAERNIKQAARKMIDMGFSEDTPTSWQLRKGAPIEGLTLKDML